MTLVRRLLPWAWSVALFTAVGFVGWANLVRGRGVDRLTHFGATSPVLETSSPTGYAGGLRMLIAPGRNHESYQWIAQTQTMIARGEWRLRHVDYDNAPAGRPVRSASVYRWWLAAVAWCDHRWSGQPIGLSVERAALWADPLLLMLFITGGTLLVARQFGPLAAFVFPLASATLFPFGSAFLPGGPDDVGLGLILAASVALTLLAGTFSPHAVATNRRPWFIASGVLGSIALWVNVSTTVPLLVGIGFGALLSSALSRENSAVILPWRSWTVAGAAGTLLAWMIEYAPDHLGFGPARLGEVHPLYALAWLGGGELLEHGTAWVRGAKPPLQRSTLLRMILAGMALVAPVGVMLIGKAPGFLVRDAFALRLSALGEGAEFPDFGSWVARTWEAGPLLAVTLPLLLLIAAGLILRRATPELRTALGLLLAPTLIALGFGWFQLGWWNQLDAMLLVLAVALTDGSMNATRRPKAPGWSAVGALAVTLPGLVLLVPQAADPAVPPTRSELEALAERDFSHWLARRGGPERAIVLAPPHLTVSLIFHGGLRGIASPYRENQEGFQGAVSLASSTQTYEAQALAVRRKLTHIVIPSWDGFLDRYAQLGANQPEHTLMGLLHRWLPPRWLRAVPYYLPDAREFADDRLVLFEVIGVQDQATALSRLTEYFLDMGQVQLATQAAHALAKDYATDLGALIAKARTDAVRRDRQALVQTVDSILLGLKEGEDESLDWDRRVSLCLVLAQGGRAAESRLQAERCLEELDDARLRHLPEATLFQFLTRCRAFGLEIEDPSLRELARTRLPVPLRRQL